jgi:hypothetical protein
MHKERAALAARGEQIKTNGAEYLWICCGIRPPLLPDGLVQRLSDKAFWKTIKGNQMRGGKRAGAGRRSGSRNKATAARQAAIAASGETPLDYMIRVMRDDSAPAERRDEMAKAAAPYVHPRLTAIEQSVEHKAVDKMTDAELDAEIARVAALLRSSESQETSTTEPTELNWVLRSRRLIAVGANLRPASWVNAPRVNGSTLGLGWLSKQQLNYRQSSIEGAKNRDEIAPALGSATNW